MRGPLAVGMLTVCVSALRPSFLAAERALEASVWLACQLTLRVSSLSVVKEIVL